ncbi:MAG: helix-turn-helix domain-containing protein [Bacillota bacterium]
MRNETLTSLPDFLTVEEAAKILRLKRSTAYEYVQQGIIPAVRLGRFVRIPKARLLEMAGLQDNRAGAANS